MADMQFGFGEVREFLPTYGGVDWQEAWENHYEEEQLPVWATAFDELGEFNEQLHQQNCVFYINDTNSDFDCLVVVDHRNEGGDWWFSREQIGDEEFDTLFEDIGPEVTVVHTKFPIQNVAEYVMRIMFKDIE